MNLSDLSRGETRKIKHISVKDSTSRFLRNLGFAEGTSVTLVAECFGSVIVRVNNSRIALDKELARRVLL